MIYDYNALRQLDRIPKKGSIMNSALRIKTMKEAKRAKRNQIIADVICWASIGIGGAFAAWCWYIIAIIIMGLDL
jgi:fatty acid desaturase